MLGSVCTASIYTVIFAEDLTKHFDNLVAVDSVPLDVPAGQALAILPFADLSPARDQEYFCDGIAEEIVNALCCVRGLHIASRTSAAQFKGRSVDVREIGTEIQVENAVDRVYFDVRRPQLLRAGNLSLGIQSQGFPDVVVWNPWVEGCARLKDMAPDNWRHMLCVEAAAVRNPVIVPAGEEWYGRQTLVAV